MKIKPVRQSKSPDYPTLEYYIKNPGMLSRNIPDRWIRNKYVASSLAAFVLCGCSGSSVKTDSGKVVVVDGQKEKGAFPENTDQTKTEIAKVAPIFVYGDGNGATGCVVFAPPVFISEEEAWQIISDAFSAHDIVVERTDRTVLKFKAPPIADGCFDEQTSPDVKVEIKMDGYDAEHDFAIQYVSKEDYLKFHYKDEICSSVYSYDTKAAAVLIRDALVSAGNKNCVVFYDPITSADYWDTEDWEAAEKKAIEDAHKYLLWQVNDFIKWLKKEQQHS